MATRIRVKNEFIGGDTSVYLRNLRTILSMLSAYLKSHTTTLRVEVIEKGEVEEVYTFSRAA